MIQNYSYYLDQFNEYGEVTEINYPIVSVVGLPSGKLNELVVFETGEKGQILALHDEAVSIMLFSQTRVKIGTKVSRSDSHISVPTGDALLGHILSPFGLPLSTTVTAPEVEQTRPIDSEPSGISKRAKITKPLATGTALVDILVPIGKGQRQLVLGDRKTGKSTFALSTANSHIQQGGIVIYAAIGKKMAEIKHLEEFMNQGNRKKNMIIVATSASDSPCLIYLTPFTAMTLAEYFRDKGEEVLIVMDDLLTHAKFYREFALLAQTFPGRDSYPADVFHIHAKLLERAGNFKHEENDQASITCLPIVETQDADLTGYIVSNLMSVTDGHIFFDGNLFAQGRRPAINIPLSVTRVGKQTQDRIGKDINRELSSLFSMYERVENLSHFGSEMTDSVKSIFEVGERVYNYLNQPAGMIIPKEVSLVLFSLVWLNIISDEASIETTRKKLLTACEKDENLLFLRSLLNAESFNDLLKNVKKYKDQILAL